MVSQGKFTHQSSTGLVALRDHVQKVGKRHVNQCHVIFLRFFGLVNWSRVLSVKYQEQWGIWILEWVVNVLAEFCQWMEISLERPSIVHRYRQRDTLAESNLTMDNPVPKIIAWFDGGFLRRASHWPPTEKWRKFSRFRWWIHQWESLLIWVE